MQGFYRSFVHGKERGDNHAEGDDGEEQEVLDCADHEEVRPERVHPVGLAQGGGADVAVGEVDVHSELEPDNLPDDAG